jgi:hypothetical protein
MAGSFMGEKTPAYRPQQIGGAMQEPDFFDGIFDNRRDGIRERVVNGQRKEFLRAGLESDLFDMRGPWGTFPDNPSNATDAATVSRQQQESSQ